MRHARGLSVFIMLALCLLACQCQGKAKSGAKSAVSNKPSPTAQKETIEDFASFDAAELYNKFIERHDTEPTDVRVLAIRSARDANPPEVGTTVGSVELMWAYLFAECRGGKWQDRMPQVYERSEHGTILQMARRLFMRNKWDSRSAWHLIMSVKDRDDLGGLWVMFASAREDEVREHQKLLAKERAATQGSQTLHPTPMDYVIDWTPSYLTLSEFKQAVHRESGLFHGKHMAILTLYSCSPQWGTELLELDGKLFQEALAYAKEALSKADTITATQSADWFWSLGWELGRDFQGQVIIELLKAGPDDSSLSRGLATWIAYLDSNKNRMGRTPEMFGGKSQDGKAVQNKHDEWVKKFPQIADFLKDYEK